MTNFHAQIRDSKPTLVDFYATWCGPCKMMMPIIDELRYSLSEKASILKVDVDKEQALAAEYTIRSVPTLIIFKNGEERWRASGVQSAATLRNVIEKLY